MVVVVVVPPTVYVQIFWPIVTVTVSDVAHVPPITIESTCATGLADPNHRFAMFHPSPEYSLNFYSGYGDGVPDSGVALANEYEY